MKRLAAFTLTALLLVPAGRAAAAAPEAALEGAVLYDCVTYVPLRTFTQALRPDAIVSWEEGAAAVRVEGVTLTAVPGAGELCVNGVCVALAGCVQVQEGRVLVPVRPLAAALGYETAWSPDEGVTLSSSGSDDFLWLARIISAESQGEPLAGQIAVGNVILNREASPDFPDSVYDVIFDPRWGGQFEPVRNGAVWQTPTPESCLAARLCLAGARTAGESLYFLAPQLTDNHWTMENRTYVTTIGCHWFYQ